MYALSSELRFPKGAITAAAPEPRKRNPLPLLCIMAIPVVEFSREGYKTRKVFG